MTSTQPITVEHVVLFKLKPNADPTKMLSSLNSLTSLNQVLHLTAGPIHRTLSSPFPFTHLLHSRFSSKQALQSYSSHPAHVAAVQLHVIPSCDDIMALDWVSPSAPSTLPPGSVTRVAFLKLNETSGVEVKVEVLRVVKEINTKLRISEFSCGENFSPARAKGYELASLVVFPGLEEMEKVDKKQEVVEDEKEKVKDHVESVIVVDYVVPPSHWPPSL